MPEKGFKFGFLENFTRQRRFEQHKAEAVVGVKTAYLISQTILLDSSTGYLWSILDTAIEFESVEEI
jgi:hypothetical protein